ncbi:hypothetical protein FOL46_002286, partial [Perkinsus olseni]
VVYRKVPGHSNVDADQLSRLLQEWKAQDVVGIGSTTSTVQPSAIIPTEDFVGLITSGVGVNGGLSSENAEDSGKKDEIQLDDVQLDHIHKAQRLSSSLSPIIGVLKSNSEESDESIHKAKSAYQAEGYCLRNGLLNKLKYPHGDPLSSPRLVICIPTDIDDGSVIADNIITLYHTGNGHVCPRYVRWRVSKHYDIPGLTHRTKVICRRCSVCQASATKRVFNEYGGHLDLSARAVWRHVSTDLAGPLPVSKPHRYQYALIAIDDYSKFTFWRGLRTATSAETTSCLVDLFNEAGIPRRVRCDGGPSYKSKLFRSHMERLGVVISPTNAFAPWSNGLAERGVSSLKSLYRRMLAGGTKSDQWEHLLSRAIRKSNTKMLPGGVSPFQLFYGREFFEETAMKLGVDNDPYQVEGYKVDDVRLQLRDVYARTLEDRSYVPRPRRRPAVHSTVQVYRADKIGKSRYEDARYRVVRYE